VIVVIVVRVRVVIACRFVVVGTHGGALIPRFWR
jgi:hypothetical protein